LANFRSNLFYFNFFTDGNFVLFAAGFYDRVHVKDLSIYGNPRTLPAVDA
jgi:hypothetical protein